MPAPCWLCVVRSIGQGVQAQTIGSRVRRFLGTLLDSWDGHKGVRPSRAARDRPGRASWECHDEARLG